MKRKLWFNAIIVSPIIALYGACPFYFIHHASFTTFSVAFLIITCTSLFLWSIHIFFAVKEIPLNNISKFIIAYAILLGVRFLLQSLVTLPDMSDRAFSLFDVLMSLLPNAIIMILCNNIVTAHEKNIAETEVQELKLQNSEAQKQVLKQQLQPHFLFNALGTLKSLISANQQKAEEYTLRLSYFLQYSIHHQNGEIVSLDKELGFVADYIALQKVRFGDAFISKIDISEEAHHQKIPVFALQILVENIFKHNHFTEKRPLEFSIKYNEHNLIIRNKKNPAKHVERNHTGLANLNNRYRLIADKVIEVNETDDCFTVTIPTIAS